MFDFEIFSIEYVLKHSASIPRKEIDQKFLTLPFQHKTHVFGHFRFSGLNEKTHFANILRNFIRAVLSLRPDPYLQNCATGTISYDFSQTRSASPPRYQALEALKVKNSLVLLTTFVAVIVNCLLEFPPIRPSLGTISYSILNWHYPKT